MSDLENIFAIEKALCAPGSHFEIVPGMVMGTEIPVFKNRFPNLRAMLQMTAHFGDKIYIIYEGRRISFAEHLRSVASIAKALEEQYGVKKGDRVAILGSNKPEWIMIFWAAASLGAIPVGLNGWWVAEEILWSIEDCEPKLLIADRRRLARVADHKLPIPTVVMEDDFGQLTSHAPEAVLPDVPLEGDDPAFIIYTAGTTGRPKGAVLTHQGITSSVMAQQFHGARLMQLLQVRPPENPAVLITSPLFHVSGMHAGAVQGLASGLKTVWMEGRFDPAKAYELIQTEKINAWAPVVSLMHRFVEWAEKEGVTVPQIGSMGNGGAPMPKALLQKLVRVFPNAIHTLALGYGSTECNAVATINFGQEYVAKPYSSGRPLPTIEIQIRDIDGKEVAPNTDGEIFIHSPILMREYWRQPEATAETLLPGMWLATGDIGQIDDDGHLIINTRARDLILRGAENIYPVEIEHCISEYPGVAEVAVVGVSHPELGQEVKAYVVAMPGVELTAESLTEWLAGKLAYFKVPAHWEFCEKALPKNAVGKVMKHLLVSNNDSPFEEE